MDYPSGSSTLSPFTLWWKHQQLKPRHLPLLKQGSAQLAKPLSHLPVLTRDSLLFLCIYTWRPEVSIKHLSQSFSMLFFTTGSLTEPRPHQSARMIAGEPGSPSVSTSPVLGLQVHTLTRGFYMALGIEFGSSYIHCMHLSN